MSGTLIIIGSGPGGYRAADYAAKQGLQVTVIEEAYAGGTCLNCGCIPTKSLCHDAAMADKRRLAEAIERKELITAQLRQGVEMLMNQPNVTFVRGKARFKDANTVEVLSVSDGSVVNTLTADNIIIATGSITKMLPIEGVDLPNVVTSNELLDVKEVPQRLCIVGAGVIGMEFASIFNAFGSKVTVVEFLKECLPATDSELAKRLRKALEKRGVEFFMQSAVKRVTPEGVVFERKGQEQTVDADLVLMATGRKPNTDGLNLEAAGILYDRSGIRVNPETMQVKRSDAPNQGEAEKACYPHLYAIGDVNGLQMLAHAATFQGFRAVNHILCRADRIRLDVMPAAVFTTPEVAGVGLTEDLCKEQGLSYTCKKGHYRANGKAMAMEETDGMVKILTDVSGRIIGCHVLGAHAADMVQEVASLMNLGVTISQLADMVHIHPTLAEVLQDTARN
ncbi:MAG: dihydrolipoyl dehydrogenase [Prevotella sp.]|nr:dihydrolipoyl dehydrogenase [Prevotella sp.]